MLKVDKVNYSIELIDLAGIKTKSGIMQQDLRILQKF